MRKFSLTANDLKEENKNDSRLEEVRRFSVSNSQLSGLNPKEEPHLYYEIDPDWQLRMQKKSASKKSSKCIIS